MLSHITTIKVISPTWGWSWLWEISEMNGLISLRFISTGDCCWISCLPITSRGCTVQYQCIDSLVRDTVWLSGNVLVLFNMVVLHQARLVLGWANVCGRVNLYLIMLLESTHRVQTSAKSVINIHLQLFHFVFNTKNAQSINDGKVEKLTENDPGSRSRIRPVPKSNWMFLISRPTLKISQTFNHNLLSE